MPHLPPDPDSLPTPRVDGTASIRLWDEEGQRQPRLDWRSSLLSVLTHVLFVALLISLVHFLGKDPPEELPTIEVSLAPDPEPPPPPPEEKKPAPKPEAPKPPPPAPPTILPRASDASSIGEGKPQAAKQNDDPSANPGPTATAPREAEPAPRARPNAEQAELEPAPPLPQPPIEPAPPVPPLPREAEPAPIPLPPVVTAPEAPSTTRPAPAPRPTPPPPSFTLRKPLAPSQAPAAEPKPRTRSSESEAPAPSPSGSALNPSGRIGAVYDAYVDAVRNKVLEHRSLLRPYFGAAHVGEVQVGIEIDASGRLIGHAFYVRSGSPNLDYEIANMMARAAPFPPPPSDLMRGGTVGIRFFIDFPNTVEAWREAYP
jgi:protein TonB